MQRPTQSTLFPYTTLFRSLNSYDVLGGPHTFNVVYSTTKFVNDNPKTIQAFVRGLDRANEWIKANPKDAAARSEEHTSELQSQFHLVCRLLLEKKKGTKRT